MSPLSPPTFSVIITTIGLLVLVLGLVSKWLEKTPVPAALLALLAGILLGPAALGWINPAKLGERTDILEKGAQLVLAMGLLSVALRIPKEYPRRHWREMLTLISLGMVLMWVVSTAAVYLILGLPFWLAALIGAIVTPTDPIACTPIVTGPVAEKSLPERLRHMISFESGANDGLAYLFVFLPFLLLTRPPGAAASYWLLHTLLYQIVVAVLVGAAIGNLAARLLRAAERRDLMLEHCRLVHAAAMALVAVGVGKLIHSDELLLVFAAGITFTQVRPGDDRENEGHGHEAVNRFFPAPMFALLGTAIPWHGWAELGWKGPLLVAAVLLLRRPAALLLLRPLLPGVRSTAEALYLGWFGPTAVAAIYYAAMIEHRLGEPRVWHVVSLIVCGSVVAHGATASTLTRVLGRTAEQQGEPPGEPHAAADRYAPMIALPNDASDADLIACVDRWAALLESEQYEAAFAFTDHDPSTGWTPQLIREAIKAYGDASDTQKVTLEGRPRVISQRKKVTRWAPHRRAGIGEVWYDLNIDGSASDLTATFQVVGMPRGLTLKLNDIHVM